MPRIDYAVPSDEVARLVSERRGGQPTPLDLLLAHNEGLLRGWNALLGAVRGDFALAGDLRELVILRIATLNGAPYEWDAHLPVARREGLPDDVITALEARSPSVGVQPHDAVLRYTDAMTRDVTVPAEVFDELREHLDETGIAELTATVAAYNMVSRFLVALEVRTEDRTGPGPTDSNGQGVTTHGAA